jgi:DNA-binding transcriptional MerR regulator
VADYYTPAQLALKLGISEAQIAELESKGSLHPKLKDGRRFFSSRQAHDLQVALRLARKQRVSLEQAFARVEDMRVCQASTAGS